MPTAINPLSHANLETNNHRIAAALAEQGIQALLAERQSLRSSGAVVLVGDVAGSGSDTLRIRRAGLGASLSMTTASSETQSATASNVDVDNADIPVGRHWLRVDETQLAQITGTAGDIDPEMVAESFTEAFDGKWMDVLATTVQSFSSDIVASTTDTASIDHCYDLMDEIDLVAGAQGPVYALLHGKQIGEIRQSARGETGAFQFREDAQSVLGYRDSNFMFELLGIRFFKNQRVASSGGSRHGAAWLPGALGWAQGTTTRVKASDGSMRPAGLPVIIEFDFDPLTGQVRIVANAYFGQAITYDDIGWGWVTAA